MPSSLAKLYYQRLVGAMDNNGDLTMRTAIIEALGLSEEYQKQIRAPLLLEELYKSDWILDSAQGLRVRFPLRYGARQSPRSGSSTARK